MISPGLVSTCRKYGVKESLFDYYDIVYETSRQYKVPHLGQRRALGFLLALHGLYLITFPFCDSCLIPVDQLSGLVRPC